jgi:hypothetical protein
MGKRGIAIIANIALLVSMLSAGTPALATWDGSVTDIVNSSQETTGCHDNPYYFNPIYGWTRSCNGGRDITNTTGDLQIFIRGYVWTSAYVVATTSYPVYNSTCSAQVGTEYRNAWQIDTPAGTIGIGFHHMGNYHFAVANPPNSQLVPNGQEVGEMASWGQPVYFCSSFPGGTATLASTGYHSHTEAAEVGTNFSDTWGYDGPGYPYYPYYHYSQP